MDESHPHVRSLDEGQTLTIIPITITMTQVMLDLADMQVLPALAILLANGSHQPIALARGLSDARSNTVSASSIIIHTIHPWRRGRGAPALLIITIIILELLALPLARIGLRSGIARLRNGVRVIRSHGRVEIHPDPRRRRGNESLKLCLHSRRIRSSSHDGSRDAIHTGGSTTLRANRGSPVNRLDDDGRVRRYNIRHGLLLDRGNRNVRLSTPDPVEIRDLEPDNLKVCERPLVLFLLTPTREAA